MDFSTASANIIRQPPEIAPVERLASRAPASAPSRAMLRALRVNQLQRPVQWAVIPPFPRHPG
jgi:hypothetical protein